MQAVKMCFEQILTILRSLAMNAYAGEFLGTMCLIFLGDGVVANVILKDTKAEGTGWLAITFGWGIALALCIYGFGGVSGAHLNPALTIGLAVSGGFDAALVPGYIIAQVAGAFCGAAGVYLYFLPHINRTENPALKLAIFSTGPAIRHTASNFFCEVVGTFALLYGVLVIANAPMADGLRPLAIGVLLIGIGLSIGGTTGYALNPARDLGPRIFHAIAPIKGKGSSDWEYGWIPVAAPIVGGLLACLAYNLLKGIGFSM